MAPSDLKSLAIEVKKWINVILLPFLLISLLASMLYLNSTEMQFLRGKFKNVTLSMFDGEWSSGNEYVPGSAAVGPNLTTCHLSLTDANHPIYCCPPRPESEQSYIDFQFPDPSRPLRVRQPAHLIDTVRIAKYNKALSIMKSLPYEDPRSFMRQANVHCTYCSGAYNQLNSSTMLKVHMSWLFFPWHRMFIYFHERILGSLIGDDTFALPFWNWDNPEAMVIPEMYTSGSLFDSNRDFSHLPPQVADINFDYVENGLGQEDQIASNLALMYHQMVSSAKRAELFMGCPYKSGEGGFCDGPGTIELTPHNALHTWVGNSLNPEREDLGAFYSAAQDPIFFSHHSNVDRLWEVWRGLTGYNQEISDPDWLDSHFFFYDEKPQLVRVTVRDVVDISKLKYTYQWVKNPWLLARPKPSIPPKIARSILKDDQNGLRLSSPINSPDFRPDGKVLGTTIRVKVHRHSNRNPKKEDEEEVLVVYGIDVKKDMYVKFDVYVNAVDETSIGPESREFAGAFVNMRQGVRLVANEGDMDMVMKKRKAVFKMGISELLQDLEADCDNYVWVTLVPRGGTGVNTTIDGVRIEYMQ